MKKMSIVFSMCVFACLLLAPPSMAAPAVAQGDKAAQVEELLKYLSYTAEGSGDKVIYMLCGAQCPRCARAYTVFAGEPDFRQEYQVRWVLWSGSDAGYYFPLENKPGVGMKELYGGLGQIEPRPVENPARLNLMTGYNGIISSMVGGLFDGSPSVNATPFIVIKTRDGFEYGSTEDFWRDSVTASFSKALPLPEGIGIYDNGIVKDIEEAEKVTGYVFVADKKDVPARLFPRDDAPLMAGDPLRKGYAADALSKTRNGWIGIRAYENPNAPLAYFKLKDGALQKK